MKKSIRSIATLLLAIFAFCTFGTSAFASPVVPTEQASTVIEYAFNSSSDISSSASVSALPLTALELSQTEGEWGWFAVNIVVRILLYTVLAEEVH